MPRDINTVNRVTLLGYLGRDAETDSTPAGVLVSNLSVATRRRAKAKDSKETIEETDWHRVVLWRSENVAPYLRKGRRLFVEGRLQTSSWVDQAGNRRTRVEVVAERLILLDRNRGNGKAAGSNAPEELGLSDQDLASLKDGR